MLLLPTSPTILEETVAKKKPKIAINIAPNRPTGITGISHIASITNAIKIPTIRISKLILVLLLVTEFFSFNPLNVEENVDIIKGSDLIRLIIPPQATAPAPIYLI